MKRAIFSVMILCAASARPLWAQQNDIAVLRAEIAKQEVVIAQLLKRIEALEQQAPPPAAVLQDLQDDITAQDDSINSLRETVNSKVNLNGYYNFRFSADGSEEPASFQQHHLGIIMAKQLGKFNFLMELELQNVPHHAEIAVSEEGEVLHAENGETTDSDLSGEGPVEVENAWMEYNHNRFLSVRMGKQLSPQYWWQNHYPNLTLSTTLPIYLRELFPPELIGVTVQGSAARPVGQSEFGVGYKFYAANNNFEGNSRADLQDGKSWGARGEVRLPTGGALRRFDAAFDVYRGHIGLADNSLDGRQRHRIRIPARGVAVSPADRMGAGQIARPDANGILRAAGLSYRRRLDHVLSPRAAREPEDSARRAPSSGGDQLSAVPADCVQGRGVPVAAAGARLHSC